MREGPATGPFLIFGPSRPRCRFFRPCQLSPCLLSGPGTVLVYKGARLRARTQQSPIRPQKRARPRPYARTSKSYHFRRIDGFRCGLDRNGWVRRAAPPEWTPRQQAGPFTFRADTPASPGRVRRLPTDFVDLRIEGFNTRRVRRGGCAGRSRTRVVLVAIPPRCDSQRLSVRRTDRKRSRAFTPRPPCHGSWKASRPIAHESQITLVRGRDRRNPGTGKAEKTGTEKGRARRQAGDPDKLYRAADAHYSRRNPSFPLQAAWLGKTGVLRNQRYVEVHRGTGSVRRPQRRGRPDRSRARHHGAFRRRLSRAPVAFTRVDSADRQRPLTRGSTATPSKTIPRAEQFRLGEVSRRASRTGRLAPHQRHEHAAALGAALYRILVDENGPVRLDARADPGRCSARVPGARPGGLED